MCCWHPPFRLIRVGLRRLTGNLRDLLDSGKLAFEQGHLHQSYELFSKASGLEVSHNNLSLGFELSCCLTSLSNSLADEGDITKSLVLAEKSLRIRSALLGRNHISVGESLLNLGSLQFRLGHINNSCDLFEEALDIILQHTRGDEYNKFVAFAYLNLGLSYLKIPERSPVVFLALKKAKRIAAALWGVDSEQYMRFNVSVDSKDISSCSA